jgi:hypothetical protein
VIIFSSERQPAGTERLLAAAAMIGATINWIALWRADLVLSHYDAKAHLVVARRIIDNITPGWQQIGGVWLPLPHLLNALPTQIDALYRTGAFASVLSIACFGILIYAASRHVTLATGSRMAACVAAALLMLNPNLLYLHATPMTEPLLLAITFLALLWLAEWVVENRDDVPAPLGMALFAAAWTRYEAWPVIAVALPVSLYACYRKGVSRTAVIGRAWRLALWPAAAVFLFLLISRITTGMWFVASGFYESDVNYNGQLTKSLLAVWWGTHRLGTRASELVALVGVALLIVKASSTRTNAPLLIPLTLVAFAALPVYAFHEGHPFRIRYMIPAAAACAVLSGMAVGCLRRRAQVIVASLLVGITLLQSPPWWRGAPMLAESLWDRSASEARHHVTACLSAGYRGEKILASMGSLAHYMQELSHEGFTVADFVHEGNGVIWQFAMQTSPRFHAGWMLVEEQSEGGDILARRIRQDATFAQGMTRICDGGGVALYRRVSQK